MYHGEKLNSVSSIVGLALALVALGSLLTVSIQTGEARVIVGFSVFGLTMVLLYSMSTLFHSIENPKLKRTFKILDHISIYLLIVGTYAPFMLVTLGDHNGNLILGVVWTLAVIGILSELFLSGVVVKAGQLIIFVSMGWACALELDNLEAALSSEGFFWLFSGGVAYTAGIALYVLDKVNWLKHGHGIWHFFVIAGSACHFVAIIGYVR